MSTFISDAGQPTFHTAPELASLASTVLTVTVAMPALVDAAVTRPMQWTSSDQNMSSGAEEPMAASSEAVNGSGDTVIVVVELPKAPAVPTCAATRRGSICRLPSRTSNASVPAMNPPVLPLGATTWPPKPQIVSLQRLTMLVPS